MSYCTVCDVSDQKPAGRCPACGRNWGQSILDGVIQGPFDDPIREEFSKESKRIFNLEDLRPEAPMQTNISREKVLWWVQERLDNCRTIASVKKGVDREGWMEDASYFAAILSLLTKDTRAAGKPRSGDVVSGETNA